MIAYLSPGWLIAAGALLTFAGLVVLVVVALCWAAKRGDENEPPVDYLEFGVDQAYTPTRAELADILPFNWELAAELQDERRVRAALRPRTGNVQHLGRAA